MANERILPLRAKSEMTHLLPKEAKTISEELRVENVQIGKPENTDMERFFEI